MLFPTLLTNKISTMGYILTAVCPSCDYKKENLYYGSGMMNREPKIPALNHKSGELEMISPGLPGYDYYHDRKMYKGDINDDFYQNFDVLISPDENYCPKCKTFQMRFDDVGTWD
jgi:rubredoxin